MPKDKLTDYSATNASNTDVGGVNIDEGMLPSAVNNAIRELMTHQANAFGAGTPLYVDETNNRVGIGTTSPATSLTVVKTGTAVQNTLELRNGQTLAAGVGSSIGFADGTGARNSYIAGAFEGSTNDDGYLSFVTRSSDLFGERLRILSSGGITFNGDTAQANALDDYEEGTWTATLSDSPSGGNTTTTDTDALYTKIGRVVYFQCAFGGNVNVTGMTSSNTLYIQGLPYTSSGINNSRFGNIDLRTVTYSSGNVPVGLMADSRTFLYFIETSASGGFNALEVSEFSNGDSIYVSGHYIT